MKTQGHLFFILSNTKAMQTEGQGRVAARYIVDINIIQEMGLQTAPHATPIIQFVYQSPPISNLLEALTVNVENLRTGRIP